ncbi:MAG: GNAT family N-acetyltransferase [Planctomycetes bacterium]|nr:GNAT family N-acetyltransferase [Planctomycetota bacterium]
MTLLRGPLTPADADGVLDDVMLWVNDPDVVKNLARFDHPIMRDEEREFLVRLFSSTNDRVFAIEEDGRYVGQIGIHQIYRPAKTGRIGVVIGRREEWGRGHASRAIELLLPVAFEQIGLNKLWAIFYTTNARMRHITEKLGFVQEGTLLDEYFHQGAFHDMVRVCLLKRMWEARKGVRR